MGSTRASVRAGWQRVTAALGAVRDTVVWFVTRREGVELVIGAVVTVLGVVVWTRAGHDELGIAIGIALVAAGGIVVAIAVVMFVLERRHEADEARDAFERELAEMRRIAFLARGVLLEVELWNDGDAMQAYADGQRANPGREIPPPPSWTAAAILARGRGALEPVRIRGWSTIAQLLRDHAEHFQHLVDQEFPGQPAERRAELRSVFGASAKAAEGAELLAAARTRVVDLPPDTSTEDRRRAEDALASAGAHFFSALEWMAGSIEQIERTEQLGREIEKAT